MIEARKDVLFPTGPRLPIYPWECLGFFDSSNTISADYRDMRRQRYGKVVGFVFVNLVLKKVEYDHLRS